MGLFGFGGTTQIGISIGTSSVKIAELKKVGKKGFSLVHFGVAQLPDEAISNREIVNHMAVVDAIKQLVSQLKIKGRNVVISLSGASVIVKKILLEQTPAKELNDAILWEAEQYVPFDINEVVFDYQVINKNGPEGKMEIMLVASKKAFVEAYQAVLKDSGLSSTVIDIDAFALQNAFEMNYPTEQVAALVDIGAASMKLTIVSEGQPVFTRDSAVGGRSLTVEIQKHLNVSYQEAELLKIDGNSQGQLPQEVFDLMHVMAENFAAEVKRSIDFYSASSAGAPVTAVYLAGGSARLPNLPKLIEDAVGLPVQLLNPFNNVNYDAKIFSQDYIDAVSSLAVVPVGLAMRGFPS
jgi:type IV pilus assembly protein PilM